MPGEHEEIKKLLEETLKLEHENHKLLKSMHRLEVYGFWMKFLWFTTIIGMPVFIYYFFMQPYMHALGFDMSKLEAFLKLLPQVINTTGGKMTQ